MLTSEDEGVIQEVPDGFFYFLSNKNVIPLLKSLFGNELEVLRDMAGKKSTHLNFNLDKEVVLVTGLHHPDLQFSADAKRYFQDSFCCLAHENVEIFSVARMYFASLNPDLKTRWLGHSELKALREFLDPRKKGSHKVFHIPIEKNYRVLKRSNPRDTQLQQLRQHAIASKLFADIKAPVLIKVKAQTFASHKEEAASTPAQVAEQPRQAASSIVCSSRPLRMENPSGSNICYLNCVLHILMNDSVLSQSWDFRTHLSSCPECQAQRPCVTQTLERLLGGLAAMQVEQAEEELLRQAYWDDLIELLQPHYPSGEEHSAGECFLHLLGRSEILANRFSTDAIWRCGCAGGDSMTRRVCTSLTLSCDSGFFENKLAQLLLENAHSKAEKCSSACDGCQLIRLEAPQAICIERNGVRFNERLPIHFTLTSKELQITGAKYRLRTAICYRSGGKNRHYFCYLRAQDGTWYYCSDADRAIVSQTEVLNEIAQSATQLIYELEENV